MKNAAALLGLALVLVLAFPAAAQSGIEGLYRKLPSPQPTSDPDKVEVVEVFWYGCPHCNRFQPYLDTWVETLPDHVRFVRMPAIFDEVWELHARAYYIADALGVEIEELPATPERLFRLIEGAAARDSMGTGTGERGMRFTADRTNGSGGSEPASDLTRQLK